MSTILLGIYFIIIGLVGLLALAIDPRLIAVLALILGLFLLIEPRLPSRS